MHSAYFDTRFRADLTISGWPSAFAIITAFARTGQKWTATQNQMADGALRKELVTRNVWLQRLTGYSPTTGHAELGWAVEITLDAACDLGLRFQQDAIYFVEGDRLFVSHCDVRRKLVLVGDFDARVDVV